MKLLLALVVVAACASAPPRIQLVESVPVETELPRPFPEAADVWVEMIDGAREAIDVAQFYVSNGERLEPVIAAIERAVKRGVKVRLVVEQSFVKVYPQTLERLKRAGVAVRELELGTGGILHAKYFVVDGREAFLGSQNFDWRALEHNVELGARIRDPDIVKGLAAVFAADWARAAGEPMPAAASPPPSALMASPRDRLPPGVAWDLPALVSMIGRAMSSIELEALTYKAGDWTELDAPLRRAAARGVHVQLLVADWALRARTLPDLQSLARVPNVEVRIVTIPPAARGFIPFARVAHAKLIVIDHAHGWLGTSNFEREYFYENRNVGLLMEGDALDRWFTGIWTSRYAARLDPEKAYTPPRIQ